MSAHNRSELIASMLDDNNPVNLTAEKATTAVKFGLSFLGQTVSSQTSAWLAPISKKIAPKVYHEHMAQIAPQLKRPGIQKRMLSASSPTELIRSTLSPSDINFRAITYLPDDLLFDIPDVDDLQYSLLDGFKATFPEIKELKKYRSPKSRSSMGKLLNEAQDLQSPNANGQSRHSEITKFYKEKDHISHDLHVAGVRKALVLSEIKDVDAKLNVLTALRNSALERLAKFETAENEFETQLRDIEMRIADAQELEELEKIEVETGISLESANSTMGFMSDSIYCKSNSSKARKRRALRRKSAPVLHEHSKAGSKLNSWKTHEDSIIAIDFDSPFGYMVTSSMDDTVRVWNLSAGRCIGQLEGHKASVRALQMEDSFIVTGSADASIRLWDISSMDIGPVAPPSAIHNLINKSDSAFEEDSSSVTSGHSSYLSYNASRSASTQDCCLYEFKSHVDEVTAIHFHKDTLVSGSSDKTIRQWDISTGRCVQTLDVLWAAAQSSAGPLGEDRIGQIGFGAGRRVESPFVAALQCYDAALASGTADGMVRLWDLRSGQIHRTLAGHTGPITCLQFDEIHMITGSLDKSIRIWDLRMGTIYDAFTYDQGVESLHFDSRRVVSATGTDVVRVYDRSDGRHWMVGPGIEKEEGAPSIVAIDCVRCKEGYMIEGRRDGNVGAWVVG
ncbi:Mitochondrial division protein 1 [Neolecta irregularis DAH-3]|uniref:Mitochondrial division protein 1 n=1 Tax=Neolecta irregularis (strain DAH-3) TaxID=1198029 RepID=A0A1U7LWV3_NEOID|nr:Mitochondrial division protein 1 [Neolecta irregularis DAH-3]|eukprot:OLL27099.1 Mitochondrial division protein 1 [Neolecta irregularis DAH-3]